MRGRRHASLRLRDEAEVMLVIEISATTSTIPDTSVASSRSLIIRIHSPFQDLVDKR